MRESEGEGGQRQRFMAFLTGLTAEGIALIKSRNTPYPVRLLYRELSEELDMLNTHYLSHLSPKSW